MITKDIQITIDGSPVCFHLTKLDAFSGVQLLRLLMRLEERIGGDGSPTVRECGVREIRSARRTSLCARSQRRTGGSPVSPQRSAFTLLDLISSLSEEELRSVMMAVLNHVSVLLPAGPHPVMTGNEWGYPELEHDTPACMKLLLEGIAWSLSGFFGGGQSEPGSAPADTAP